MWHLRALLLRLLLPCCLGITRKSLAIRFKPSVLRKRFSLNALRAVTNESTTVEASPPFVGVNLTETSTVQYNWREFLPQNATLVKVVQWFMTGTSDRKETEVKIQRNLASVARLLLLLRYYERHFGIPLHGGPAVQRQVLSDITQDLYASGAPVWVLENVMERVAEGMTGRTGVQYLLLPNRCFIFYPASPLVSPNQPAITATTDMFKIVPGFHIAKLGAVEQVAVRLASFASNTRSIERLRASSLASPRLDVLAKIQQEQTQQVAAYLDQNRPTAAALAHEILNLASSTYGLFFYLNNPQFQANIMINAKTDQSFQFWCVSGTTRDLFTRLAAHEAAHAMQQIRHRHDNKNVLLYPPKLVTLFRILSAAGACAMWFGGSVPDMVVSGALAVLVAYVDTFKSMATEERLLTEVVASFLVGMCSGALAIQWPNRFSFGAIAVASIMDLLQGFKVVYAVIEVMSRNMVAGAGRLLEGILFTGLISYSLRSGLDFVFRLKLGPGAPKDYASMLVESVHKVPEYMLPLILPFSAVAWSGLFRPSYLDLPCMAFHGMLAFSLTMAGAPLFVAALCVTFSAGIFSRFTGREALGNTLAGLYALVPGTYMVRALLTTSRINFLESVLVTAATIGLGAWTGTILCSPTILGKTSGWSMNRRNRDSKKQAAMLYF